MSARDVAVQDSGLQLVPVDQHRCEQRVEGPDALVVPGRRPSQSQRGLARPHRIDHILIPGGKQAGVVHVPLFGDVDPDPTVRLLFDLVHEVLRHPPARRVQHAQHDRLGRIAAAGLVAGRLRSDRRWRRTPRAAPPARPPRPRTSPTSAASSHGSHRWPVPVGVHGLRPFRRIIADKGDIRNPRPGSNQCAPADPRRTISVHTLRREHARGARIIRVKPAALGLLGLGLLLAAITVPLVAGDGPATVVVLLGCRPDRGRRRGRCGAAPRGHDLRTVARRGGMPVVRDAVEHSGCRLGGAVHRRARRVGRLPGGRGSCRARLSVRASHSRASTGSAVSDRVRRSGRSVRARAGSCLRSGRRRLPGVPGTICCNWAPHRRSSRRCAAAERSAPR